MIIKLVIEADCDILHSLSPLAAAGQAVSQHRLSDLSDLYKFKLF